jgi:hypothetical protein
MLLFLLAVLGRFPMLCFGADTGVRLFGFVQKLPVGSLTPVMREVDMLQTAIQRRAVRRAVRTRCQVVGMQEFELFSDRVVDLSPRGMLVACDRLTRLGDDMLVSFRAPGHEDLWFDAEAVVARIVSGQRWGDLGYCAGLDFTYFEKHARQELLARLAGYPPPIPRRRLRTARDRAWVDSVLIRPIVMLGGPTRARAPLGVFSA